MTRELLDECIEMLTELCTTDYRDGLFIDVARVHRAWKKAEALLAKLKAVRDE